MVNEAGGTLPGLALRRVLGKPHCVTEYNHAAPNTFGSEGFLLLAAYGALQDWDAIMPSPTSTAAAGMPGIFRASSTFAQHPTKMATLPAAVAMFVRGDVRPADKQIVVSLPKDREMALLLRSHAWELVHCRPTWRGARSRSGTSHRHRHRGNESGRPQDLKGPVPGPLCLRYRRTPLELERAQARRGDDRYDRGAKP